MQIGELMVYSWKNNSKRKSLYGRVCKVLAIGKMNSVQVQFQDGSKEVVSRFALKQADINQTNKSFQSSFW